MASIIASLLSSYLRVFLKGYEREQLDLNLGFGSGSGEAVLRDIQFDERVIHKLCRLPPTLQVSTVGASALTINLPWARLNTEPVRVALSGLSIHLSEVSAADTEAAVAAASAPIPELDALLARFKSTKQQQQTQQEPEDKKQRRALRIIEDMEVKMTDLSVKVDFLDEKREGPGPCVAFKLASIELFNTDQKYTHLPLQKVLQTRVQNGFSVIYKELAIGAASLTVSRGDFVQDLVNLQPMSIQAEIKRRAGMSTYRSIDITVTLPKISVKWQPESWQTFIDAVNAFVWCVAVGKSMTASGSTPRLPVSPESASTSPQTTTATLDGQNGGLTKEEIAALDKIDIPEDPEDTMDFAAAAFKSSSLPVVKFHVSLDIIDVVYPEVARLFVNQASARVVIDHLPVSSEVDLDEWRKHKQISFQFCVVEVGCYCLVSGQEALALLNMKTGPFLDGNFTVRPSLRIPHKGCGKLSFADGYATIGAFGVQVSPQFINQLDKVVKSSMPKRSFPKNDLKVIASSHVPTDDSSAGTRNKSKTIGSLIDKLWWMDNIEFRLITHGIELGLVHFNDANHIRVAGTEVKCIECSFARHPERLIGFTNTLLDGKCNVINKELRETLTVSDYQDTDYIVVGSSRKSMEVEDQQPHGSHLLRSSLQISDFSVFVADEELGKANTRVTHYILEPSSLSVQLAMFKPINFIASFFSEDTSPTTEETTSIPSVTAVVKMGKNQVCIDQNICADLVDLVTECWNSFGKKVTKHVQHAELAEKAKKLKEKETEKHKEGMDKLKEGGMDAVKGKVHTAQHRVLPFRVGVMMEAEDFEVKVLGDDHVLERVRDSLEHLEEFGVQHVINTVVAAVRNSGGINAESLIAPMQQTLAVARVEGLFGAMVLSDKVSHHGMRIQIEAALKRAFINAQPMALIPFSVNLKQLPRRVLDEQSQSQMIRASAVIHTGDENDHTVPVQLSLLLCGWDLQSCGDLSEVARSVKSIGKAAGHAAKNTTHKEELVKLGHEVEHAMKKAAEESKSHTGGGEGVVESITKHLGILDKVSVELSLSNTNFNHCTTTDKSSEVTQDPTQIMDLATNDASPGEKSLDAPSTFGILASPASSNVKLGHDQKQLTQVRMEAAEIKHKALIAEQREVLKQAVSDGETFDRLVVQSKMDLAMMQADAEEKRQSVASLNKRLALQKDAHRRLTEENKRLHASLDPKMDRIVVEQTQMVTSSLTEQLLEQSEHLVEAQQGCAHLRSELEKREEEHRNELAKFAAQKQKRSEELRAHIKALEENVANFTKRGCDTPTASSDEQLRAAQRELKQQEAMHATYMSLVDSPPEMVVVREPVFLINLSSSLTHSSSATATSSSQSRGPSGSTTVQKPLASTSNSVPSSGTQRRHIPTAPPPTAPPKFVRPNKPPPPPPPKK